MSAKGRVGETSGQVKPEQENIIRIKAEKEKQSTHILLVSLHTYRVLNKTISGFHSRQKKDLYSIHTL